MRHITRGYEVEMGNLSQGHYGGKSLSHIPKNYHHKTTN